MENPANGTTTTTTVGVGDGTGGGGTGASDGDHVGGAKGVLVARSRLIVDGVVVGSIGIEGTGVGVVVVGGREDGTGVVGAAVGIREGRKVGTGDGATSTLGAGVGVPEEKSTSLGRMDGEVDGALLDEDFDPLPAFPFLLTVRGYGNGNSCWFLSFRDPRCRRLVVSLLLLLFEACCCHRYIQYRHVT
jgi:hypothetical protein